MKNFLVGLIPGGLCGKIFRFFATLRRPAFFARFMISRFAELYSIDVRLADVPEKGFSDLLEFFLREPKPEARPVDSDPAVLVTPTESLLSQAGNVTEKEILVVKGEKCSFETLMGRDCAAYEGGLYAILYLSPADFHRIYAPCDARLLNAKLIRGAKKPVFLSWVEKHPEVFVTNQRVVMEFDTGKGRFIMAAVGALNVGEITTKFPLPSEGGFEAEKGREIAAFEFGSTVVIAFEKDRFGWRDGLEAGAKLKLGEALAIFRK